MDYTNPFNLLLKFTGISFETKPASHYVSTIAPNNQNSNSD